MKELHKAALVRAYRTLATGLAGAATTTGLTALIAALVGAGTLTPVLALTALGASVGGVVVSAWGSYWRAVSQGIPEVELRIENERLKLMLEDEWASEPGSDDIAG